MASELPPTDSAPITDRSKPPRGVIPRSAQTWLLVGLAVVILLVIATTGHPTPPEQAALAAQPAIEPASPAQVEQYQGRLRELQARAAETVGSQRVPPALAVSEEPPTAVGPTPAVADPNADDRRRREYESLFASNVVVSRRPTDQLLVDTQRPATARQDITSGQPSAMPSIDEVAAAVLRAAGQAASTPQAPAAPVLAAPQAQDVRQRAASGPPQAGSHRVFEGTILDAVLTNRLHGAMVGPVNALVTTDVYAQDLTLVIPAGSRVLGRADRVQSVGEERLAVAFHRVLLPNGRDISLNQFAGANQLGDVGLRDQVNRHLLSTFGASAAVGLISGFSQWVGSGFNTNRGATVIIGGGASDATSQSIAQTMNRFVNQIPTITIREGHRIAVYVTSDLDLPPYTGGLR